MNTIGSQFACQIIDSQLGFDKNTPIAVNATNNKGLSFFARAGGHLFDIERPITQERLHDAIVIYQVLQRLTQ